jgi:4-amino-4-deoxy-L-arabinose transferase-like glycosyltransferase
MGSLEKNFIISFIIVLAFLFDAILLVYPQNLWWDEAVYISIGKYIYSYGNSGFFEVFRPISLPIILGFFWFLGLNPIFFGKILAVIAHIGMIYLIYKIGDKAFGKNVGLLSSALIAFTPFIYIFSTKILSDILSTTFALTAVYIFIKDEKLPKKNMFVSGLFTALAFLTRFPQGVLAASLIIVILVKEWRSNRYFNGIHKSAIFLIGFMILATPYLTYNYFAYGSPTYPFTAAHEQIEATAWFHETNVFYYFSELPVQNIFFIISVLGIIYFFKKRDFKNFRKTSILLTLLLLFAYFSYLSAKDLRFSIVFLPYIALLSSYGAYNLLKKHAEKTISFFMIIILIASFAIGTIILYQTNIRFVQPAAKNPYNEFLDYFMANKVQGSIITSNAMIGAYVDNKLINLIDWEIARERYDSGKNESSILALDTCSVLCDPNRKECFDAKEEFIEYVKKTDKAIFHKTGNQTGVCWNCTCDYYIFEIK